MENTEALPQKIVDRKTIVLKSRLDPDAAKLLGEREKVGLFAKFGFLKPDSNDISLVGFTKYYEPSVVVGGKYSVDYCKKHFFELKPNTQSQTLFVGGEEFKLEPSNSGKPSKVLKLTGEEHLHYENETYFVLDKLMREISAERNYLAPFESAIENPESALFDFRKVNISLDDEIAFLRSRIVKKPLDADVIIREIFEINERMIIYNPIYELAFQEIKTGKVVTLLIDGITSKLTVVNYNTVYHKEESHPQAPSKVKSNSFQENPKDQSVNDASEPAKIVNTIEQSGDIQQELSPQQISTPESTPEPKFEAEDATDLATDALRRLGLKNKITPTKVSVDGESYVVELNLQDKAAKVWVNTKTKEIREYEIQEANAAY